MQTISKRKPRSKEFKQEAVKLLQGGERTYPEVADMVAVDQGIFRKWKRQLESEGEDAFRGHGKRKAIEAAVPLLREENRKLKEEQEILKKRRRTLPSTSSEVRLD
jgi:transposase